jgi:hypothetical protein
VLALAAIILILPDQSRELYSLYFDPYKDINLYIWTRPDQPTARSLLSVLGSLISDARLCYLFLSVAIFQVVIFASFHTLRNPDVYEMADSAARGGATFPRLKYAPVHIAMVSPGLILLLGMHAAWVQLARFQKKEYWLSEHLTYWLLLAFLLLSAVFAAALHRIHRHNHPVRSVFALYRLPYFAVICGVTLVLLFLSHIGWDQLPQHVGSLGIIFLFSIDLALFRDLAFMARQEDASAFVRRLAGVGFCVLLSRTQRQSQNTLSDIIKPPAKSGGELQGLVRGSSGSESLRSERGEIPGLHRGGGRRRDLCGLEHRRAACPYAGLLPGFRAALVRDKLRLWRQPWRGGVYRVGSKEREERELARMQLWTAQATAL